MKNIVFVLGAGASCPFQFPLGGKLVKNIIEGIAKVDHEDIYDSFRSYRSYSRGDTAEYYDFLEDPYHALYLELLCSDNNKLVEEYGAKKLQEPKYHIEFAELLNRFSASTIDYILADNPSYSLIGRLYIVLEILKAYFSSNQTLEEVFQNGSIKIDYDRYKKTSTCSSGNWYASLANYIKSFGGDAASLEEIYGANPIKVVTFNYDMSLEYFFKECFMSEVYSGFDVGRITSHIFHVYGKVDVYDYRQDYDGVEANYLKLLFEQANKISLIRRNSDENEDISKHIKASDVICIFGFGFDKDNRNVTYLDPNMVDSRKKVYVHNYDDHRYINNEIAGLNIHKNIELRSKGEIKNLFDSGFISERIVL